MSQEVKKVPDRDMERTPFAEILSKMDKVCPGLEVAVFYDQEGETIDYHSYLEPYDTRLVAAHLGVVTLCAMRNLSSLKLGPVDYMEIHGEKRDTITVSMGEGLFLSVMVTSGNFNQIIQRKIREVIRSLKDEINS